MTRLTYTFLLIALLAGAACRGPVRDPAALEPPAAPEAIAPPTSTILPSPTLPPTVTPVVVIHRVVSGDSLYAIALRYGSTVEAIQAVNNLPPGTILSIGQELRIPVDP